MTQHPSAPPIFLRLPERVSGMPIWRDNFAFAEDIPRARFKEKESPGTIPRRFWLTISILSETLRITLTF
jgi:hypothetical protein